MSIYLGNMSAQQMCERLGIEYTEQIAEMELAREPNAHVKGGVDKWHCFDIPFEVVCGTREVAQVWYELLSPVAEKMKCPIRFSVVPAERKEE